MAKFELGTFVNALGEQCRAVPLTEKWVIAPSYRVGYQWLDQLARSGQPILNARVKTLRSLAVDLAGPALASSGRSLVRRIEARAIMGGLLVELGSSDAGYLCELEVGASLVDALVRVVGELRMAGATAKTLSEDRFEVAAKGRQLAWLLERFERALEDRALVDWPAVFEWAAARLEGDEAALPEGAMVLFALGDSARLRGRERRLVEAIDSCRVRSLPVDDPEGRPVWLTAKTAELFGAVGEVSEVREVMRRCVRAGVPLGDIEVVVSDPVTYLPLLEEAAVRLAHDPDSGLPMTFSDGVSVSRSAPARALLGWLSWIGGDFAQADLVRMIQEELLDVGLPKELGIGATRVGAILREVPVGRGARRYGPQLRRAIWDQKEQREQALKEKNEERASWCEKKIQVLERLAEVVAELVPKGAEEDAITAEALLETAASMMARGVPVRNRLDGLCRQALREEIAALAELGEAFGQASAPMADQLVELAASLRVDRGGPRPGAVFVSSLPDGGHSGRGHTFVVGLDDSRFPGAGLQDPLLLDEERAVLSPELVTAAERLSRKIESFGFLMARLRGRVTLSFCSRSLTDDRRMFPAQPVMRAFQQLSGEEHADQERFFEWLGPPVSLAPVVVDQAIDPGEWWLATALDDRPIKNARDVLETAFPNLGRGRVADEARASDRFTKYDGWVPEAGADLNPYAKGARVLSASRLEKLGACPLDFFFSHVLGIEPPEEYGQDPSVWLDPMARGTVLHEVFRRFMVEISASGQLPDFDSHAPLIGEMLRAELGRLAEEIPPPSNEVFERECDEMLRIVRIFVRAEQRHCEQWSPEYFEVAVGLPSEGEGSELDSEEPVSIRLGGGKQIAVRGRIDRIDAPAGRDKARLVLWDYKTGSAYKYDKSDPFRGGRVVQHAFYLEMLRAHLRRLKQRRAVDGFGYFFPGLREYGRRISWDARELEQGPAVIAVLCDLLASGSFPDTEDEGDIKYSDYRIVRANAAQSCEQARLKLENPENSALTDFARLRGFVCEDDYE